MNSSQKLQRIFEIARACKTKRLSELTLEEKQAVMMCGDLYPASIDNAGKVKYDKKSAYATLAPAYADCRNFCKMLPGTFKGFTGNSFHIIIDEPLPETKESTWQEALLEWPSFITPPKSSEYITLEFLQLPETTRSLDLERLDIKSQDLAMAIADTACRVKRNSPRTKVHDAIIGIAHCYRDEFTTLAEKLSVDSCATVILTAEGEIPRGSISLESLETATSPLSTYIYLAHRGKFIRKSDM